METYRIFLVFLLIVAAESQFYPKIPCHDDETCKSVLDPSQVFKCINDNCMCFDVTNKSYHFCVNDDIIVNAKQKENITPLVGRTCADNKDCALKHGFCNVMKAQCDCDGNYVSARNGTQCLRIARQLRDHCVDDIQCLAIIRNSTCDAGVCRCEKGFHQMANECHRNIGYKEACHNHKDCEHVEAAKCYEQSDRQRRICDCEPDMVINTDGLRCLLVAKRPGDNCAEAVQCTAVLEGAECLDKRCRCRPGYHFAGASKRCVHTKAYGEECFKEEESCYQLANPDETNALTCTDKNICECINDKYIFANGLCHYSGASSTVFQISIAVASILAIWMF